MRLQPLALPRKAAAHSAYPPSIENIPYNVSGQCGFFDGIREFRGFQDHVGIDDDVLPGTRPGRLERDIPKVSISPDVTLLCQVVVYVLQCAADGCTHNRARIREDLDGARRSAFEDNWVSP
jgi:hypothetical protein